MTNQEAMELLAEFQHAASEAVRAAVWAEAFLLEGGTPTWDAVKSVSQAAVTVQQVAKHVERLRDLYEDIIP